MAGDTIQGSNITRQRTYDGVTIIAGGDSEVNFIKNHHIYETEYNKKKLILLNMEDDEDLDELYQLREDKSYGENNLKRFMRIPKEESFIEEIQYL